MSHKSFNYFAPVNSGFLAGELGPKSFYIVLFAVISALIIDSLVNWVADFISQNLVTFWGVTLFFLLASVYLLGQYFILQFIKSKSKDIRSKSPFLNLTYKAVTIVQLILAANLLYLILQIIITEQYSLVHLILATVVSFSLAAAILILFAARLFKWFRSHRSSIVIILYGISASALALTILVAITADVRNLLTKDQVITPHSPVVFPSYDPGTLTTLLSDIYNYADIVSTLLFWISTVLLLHYYYSKRLTKSGLIKYWILITLPIIYYLSTFVGFFDLYVAESASEEYYFYLYISLNSTAAALLFGLAFRIVAKTIRHNSAVRNYIMIAAFGFVLLYVSNQSTLIAGPYPPFGIFTICFMGLSAYLIYIGIYSAAISMSEDARLRQLIRRSAIEESKMLVSIGAAQIQEQLERKVLSEAKRRAELMTKETGIQLSLSEVDMRTYLNDVMREIKVLRNIDEIIKKGREILDNSFEFLGCMSYGGLRLVYNNYFDAYEKVMDKYKKNEHSGIKLVTSIDQNSIDLVKPFLKIGVEIRHVKNLPPIDFAASDREIIATIQKSETSEMIQNLLVSNEAAYLDHFVSIFEELWKNGIDAADRIRDIEEGIDLADIEIIPNPKEGIARARNIVKSAREEVSVMFASANPLRRQIDMGALQLLKDVSEAHGAKARLLIPSDFGDEHMLSAILEDLKLQCPEVEIRSMDKTLRTRITIVLADKKECIITELKDDTKDNSYSAAGLSTYSKSKSIVSSYVSIFESIWKQTELYEQLKVHDKMQKEFINIAAHELRTPTQAITGYSELLEMEPENMRIYLNPIIRNSKRLQRLSEDILDLTRIESQSLKLTKE
ncbi:MAG TPA: histidine kinase dimerization/phospho-acceptor domain-containing protein, partial [Nitrososphaeraceae archaeon]|nr:histidine kinase dimerization/phospho-acceptor domain-containing protein [Nitrososphaeraceae archaeon]